MILICEYCGAEIDTDKEDVCPFCGGTFQYNKDYLENKARQVESEQLDMEQKKLDIEKQKQADIAGQVIELRTEIIRNSDPAAYTSKQFDALGNLVGKILGIIIFAIIGIVFVITCIQELTSDDGSTTEYYAQEDVGGESYVTVNYKAQAKTSRYTVLCDGFSNVNNYASTPAQGNCIVSAHFIVKNISDTAIRTASSITCTADGMVCVQMANNGLPALPETIEKGSMGSGNVVFEVPANAAAYDIQYGEYVTIHIENASYKNNANGTEENN